MKSTNIKITPLLANKSKEELLRIIQKMLAQEPTLQQLLSSPEEKIRQMIQELDIAPDKEWDEFYDYIPERVEVILKEVKKLANPSDLLLMLLCKIHQLNQKYDQHGSTQDSLMMILERLQRVQQKLHPEKSKDITADIARILGKDFDQFMKELEHKDDN